MGRLLPLDKRTSGGGGFSVDGDVQAWRWRLSSREVAGNGRKESGKPLEHPMAATDEGKLEFRWKGGDSESSPNGFKFWAKEKHA